MTHLITFLTNIKQQNQVSKVTTLLISINKKQKSLYKDKIYKIMAKYVSKIIKNLNLSKINNKIIIKHFIIIYLYNSNFQMKEKKINI